MKNKNKNKSSNKTSAFDKGRLLRQAAQEGNIVTVEKFLRQGANPNTKDTDGFCALSYAVMEDNADIVRLLAENGANVHVTIQNGLVPDGATLLMLSAGASKDLVVPKILLEKGIDINAKDRSGNTALMYAANTDNALVCEFFITSGAELEAQNFAGETALVACAKNDCSEAARVLLTAGANTNILLGQPQTIGLLHIAAHDGSPEFCRLLLDNGADVNVSIQPHETDEGRGEGMTPLMFAALHGNIDVARVLIEKGANIDAQDKMGRTALMIAAFADETATARLLIESGANLELMEENGRSALFLAINSPIIVKMLLAKGVNVNLVDKEGLTPLVVAVIRNDPISAKALIDAGARTDIGSKDGVPLMSLAREGTEIFQLLQEAGQQK